MAKRPPDPEQERENAYICLFCTKPECTGAEQCFGAEKETRQGIPGRPQSSAKGFRQLL